MRTAIYILWGLVPTFFFIMWAISALEKTVGKKRTENPSDFLKSFLFTAGCFGILALFEVFFIDSVLDLVGTEYFSHNVLFFLSYPVILLIAAQFVGGSKPIRITKAPGKR